MSYNTIVIFEMNHMLYYKNHNICCLKFFLFNYYYYYLLLLKFNINTLQLYYNNTNDLLLKYCLKLMV